MVTRLSSEENFGSPQVMPLAAGLAVATSSVRVISVPAGKVTDGVVWPTVTVILAGLAGASQPGKSAAVLPFGSL